MMLFLIQLAFNSTWSILFFGYHLMLIAFGEIIVLWFFISMTMFVFKKIDKRAYYLMIPYLAWVSFAALLNFVTWYVNSGLF